MTGQRRIERLELEQVERGETAAGRSRRGS